MAEKETNLKSEASLRVMVNAGVFYGVRKSKVHPKMKPFVALTKGGMEIIDLDKTCASLMSALEFLKTKIQAGEFPLLVGTQPMASEEVAKLGQEFNYPFVVNRWLGGLLTNLQTILGRMAYFKKLKKNWESKAFEQYPKKEKTKIQKEIDRLAENFFGLENLDHLPGILIIINPNIHKTAVREAEKMKIPIVALGNLNTNPAEVDHLIPGNDLAKTSINWFLDELRNLFKSLKSEGLNTEEAANKNAKENVKN